MSVASQRHGLDKAESRPFSLRTCIESSVASARANARKKAVKIADVVHARVPDSVQGDPLRVHQDLMSLLSDAVRSTPAGGKVALLVTSHKAGELHAIQFAVSDSGSGSTRTFTIELPAVSLDAANVPHDFAEQHPLRILVAEDNLVNQMVVRLLLARLGYVPDFAGNGRDALAAVEKRPYDVVLMDLHMPVLDGLGAARELCARYPQPRRPRIIALTASVTADDRRIAETAGMDDYVPKPVTALALMAALERCGRVEAAAATAGGARA